MGEVRESRRVVLTKRMLKDALIELMSEKPLEEISVAELCRRADVQRATFYNHYSIIEDLFDDVKRDEPQEPYSSILGGSFDRLVQAYSSYRPGRYTYLGIKHQIPDFMESSEIYVKANCDALRKTRPNAPEALVDYLGFFLTRGCQAMSKKYLEEMPRLTPEQISHLVEVCAMRLPSICDELEEFFK